MTQYSENSDSCANGVSILSTPIIYFISGFLVFMVQIFLISMLKRSRYLASRGDRKASNILVIPIYYIAVVYLVAIGVLVGIDDMLGYYDAKVFMMCIKWGLYRLCSETLAVFLMHNGVGVKVFHRSLFFGSLWATFSTIVPLVLFATLGWGRYLIGSTVLVLILDCFYFVMWLAPAEYVHRRPALVVLSRFFAIGLLLFAAAHIILYYRSDLRASCMVEVIIVFADLLQPLVIFYTMQQDSQFWQGLYCPGDKNTVSASNLNQPLLGMWELGRETIGVVAESMASLESHVVPVIPFAVLKIDTSGYFSGGSARVYKGMHRQDEVAVKILFCIELTPERVISFCNEASVLHALQHPNIVTCYGVAVMPPAICLITEWCHHGSLYDLLHTSEYFIRDSSMGRLSSVSAKSNKRGSILQWSGSAALRPSYNHCTSSRSHSNASSDESHRLDTDGISEVLLRLEEGNTISDSQECNSASGTGKSGGSNFTERTLSSSVNSHSRRVHHNTLSIVVDLKNNDVTELHPADTTLFEDSTANEGAGAALQAAYRMVKRLKSAATVMQSRIMGFGLGPSDAITLDDPKPLVKSGSSRSLESSRNAGSLLASGDPSRQSLGYCLPVGLRLRMVRDCCAGVAFLHSKGMMHCDIKSLNFLVTTDFVVKLADLGEARPYREGMSKADRIAMPK